MSRVTIITCVVILLLFADNHEAIFGMKLSKLLKNLRPRPKYTKKTFTYESSVAIDPITIDTIVRLHNEKRQELFYGVDGKPKATLMYKLNWDERLATTSNLWARECKCFPLNYGLGDNPTVSKQGTILSCSTQPEPFQVLIQNWFDDGKFLHFEKGYRLHWFARKNRFIQMASGNNYAIGCSHAICSNKNPRIEVNYQHVQVCSYEIGVFPKDIIYDTDVNAKRKCNAYSKTYPELCLHPLSPNTEDEEEEEQEEEEEESETDDENYVLTRW